MKQEQAPLVQERLCYNKRFFFDFFDSDVLSFGKMSRILSCLLDLQKK